MSKLRIKCVIYHFSNFLKTNTGLTILLISEPQVTGIIRIECILVSKIIEVLGFQNWVFSVRY